VGRRGSARKGDPWKREHLGHEVSVPMMIWSLYGAKVFLAIGGGNPLAEC